MKKEKILNVIGSKRAGERFVGKRFSLKTVVIVLKMFLEREGIVHFEQDDYLVGNLKGKN